MGIGAIVDPFDRRAPQEKLEAVQDRQDKQDAERMQPAGDSTEIDTTDLQVEDVVDRIEALVRARQAA